ncbi:hypothetical protein [Spirulina sp. 06S082]|uniref:hypothetical protein n=1 Tax=Spirulina sp. 06S082 TaxID=3110248 RepID=UPI002B216115|nr:hypothetical protein [Spirulina sp. 06S082]MEA5469837.1 hypothetical protein [Spirulina sp. 06S082]
MNGQITNEAIAILILASLLDRLIGDPVTIANLKKSRIRQLSAGFFDWIVRVRVK